ncbi:hypothetical protein EUTSA_v10017452mg [Eutrema salsugineum]|uniref:Transmembrane protein n=2 Tax=Eutrema salsugineum TaxID=72664 RepID=V4MGL6_EUTSA|nr:hypothetical protein EUTSA_v10017452mg [Eutrema salsugineum]
MTILSWKLIKREKKKFQKTTHYDCRIILSRKTRRRATMCCDDDCRPLGFLLGLPFAFLSLLLSIVGVVIWIVGLLLSCICPCCLCVTILVEMALGLIKAPIHVMEWFTSTIPC